MPIFRYSGYTADGSPAAGAVEAAGPGDAAARIKAAGVFPGSIEAAGAAGGASRIVAALRRPGGALLVEMTRQTGLLLSSGVTLVEALDTMAATFGDEGARLAVALKERVSGGASLSKALADFPSVFPDFYVGMVEAGEEAGALPAALTRLADYLERTSAAKARVRTALIYPIFMTGVSFVVLSFLFSFVMPRIARIFKDSKAALPAATRLLIFASDLFIGYWWAVLAVSVAAALLGARYARRNRRAIDAALLMLPGGVFQSLYYGRFARTLGSLLDGGLPILKALRLSAASIGNAALSRRVLDAERAVAEGRALSASLVSFPPAFLRLAAAGEKSGRLSSSLIKAAEAFEADFNRKVERAVAVFEPAMIVAMGLAVGFIVLAVLLPIMQMNQLVR